MREMLVSVSAILLCLAVMLGFAGRIHPAADSLSLIRMPLGICCALLAIVCASIMLRRALGACALAVAFTTVPLLFAGQAGGTLTLYNKNIWFANDEIDALAKDIIASDADVVTLQELSYRNDRILLLLAADYPHRHICQFSGWSGVVVLSRSPFLNRQCSSRRALALAQIMYDGNPLWVGAVHMPWPHPYPHEKATNAALELLRGLDEPVVLAGDFNIFPWASSVHRLKRVVGGQAAGPLRPSFYLEGFPLFLDHVFAPGGGRVDYRPLLGSDHYGLLAQLHVRK